MDSLSYSYMIFTIKSLHVHLHLKSKDSSLNNQRAPKPRVNDGLKMRASVRMTRYLESWGAVKPFAHLQNREGFTPDTIVNGKPRFKVRSLDCTPWFIYIIIKMTVKEYKVVVFFVA